MAGKRSQAILAPAVGMVIQEDDPRGGSLKRIVALDLEYVYCRGGRYGTAGRRSKIKRRRLAEGRYILITKEPTP